MKNFEQWNEIIKEDNYRTFLNPIAIYGDEAYKESGYRDSRNIKNAIIKYYSRSNFGENPNLHVLDYGCGDGRIMQHFINYDIFGVDVSENLINKAIELYPECEFMKCNESGKFELGLKFDIIYSITVFIHMTINEGIQIIDNLKDKLITGGLLITDIPIYEETTDDGKWLGVTCWSRKNFEVMAKNLGFEILEMYVNPGKMIWPNIGPVHGFLNVLRYGKK